MSLPLFVALAVIAAGDAFTAPAQPSGFASAGVSGFAASDIRYVLAEQEPARVRAVSFVLTPSSAPRRCTYASARLNRSVPRADREDMDGQPVPARTDTLDEELLSEFAHDFKTPLGLIAGYAELLRFRDDPETSREAPIRIEEASQRLDAAIDDLLELVEAEYPGLARRFVELRRRAPWEQRPPLSPGGDSGLHKAGAEPATRRILVVDDDEELRELLRRTLPTDAVEILEARNGREALERVADGVPDLVVLDWSMPERSGADVLAELKRRRLRLPVIVLTASADPRHRRAAESYGVEVFLTKPFSPLELLREIERLLA